MALLNYKKSSISNTQKNGHNNDGNSVPYAERGNIFVQLGRLVDLIGLGRAWTDGRIVMSFGIFIYTKS